MQLFKLNTAEDEASLLTYADSQWPLNTLWIEGGNATSCSAISNKNRSQFAKIEVPCQSDTYSFYCEYKSKQTFLKNKINKTFFHDLSANTNHQYSFGTS
jgi:hypothetical protein